MTKEQLEKYRDQLQAVAVRVRGTLASLEDQARSPTGGEASGGLSNAPLHLGDLGSEAYNQELGATLLENEAYIRNEVLEALGRVERGTYGRCEHCGQPIPVARLDALPYARHCAACATRLQAGRRVNLNEGRPANWLGEPGHEGQTQTGPLDRVPGRELGSKVNDTHAAGTPGGGTAQGGLAGANIGGGSPTGARLEDALGRGDADDDPGNEEIPEAQSGRAGGAVGGTPANKRGRGAKADKPTKSGDPIRRPRASAPAPKKPRKKKSG
jgi:RNA polymerase-binding transcription factor DksA